MSTKNLARLGRNRTVFFFAPKGLRIIAQGCREAATLGKHNPTAQPQRGCVRECRYIK
ncbi:MAG: hypothetical protein BECKG1743D_GA0114223_102891, partial [Candidatus Kentron sp. G]